MCKCSPLNGTYEHFPSLVASYSIRSEFGMAWMSLLLLCARADKYLQRQPSSIDAGLGYPRRSQDSKVTYWYSLLHITQSSISRNVLFGLQVFPRAPLTFSTVDEAVVITRSSDSVRAARDVLVAWVVAGAQSPNTRTLMVVLWALQLLQTG